MKTSSQKVLELNIRNKVLDLSSPRIMGILNATPDSFSEDGIYKTVELAVERIAVMVAEGASIIDVGGESTRPGSDAVSEKEELGRVLPILEKVISQFPNTFFSIDTTKYRVAEEALKLGTHFVNDISGLQKEPRLADLCVKYEAGYIMMHSQGNPKVMQQNPTYDDVVKDVFSFFETQLTKVKKKGLDNIIIDPGIGFGKTVEHNLKLLANISRFKKLGYPILVGASRKSMLSSILGGRSADDRLAGTIATHYHSLTQGADIIRVHDVKEAHDSLLIYEAIKNA